LTRPALSEPLYVATSNPGKLRDFSAAAAVFGVEIATLPGLASVPAPEETGETFAANARLKAEAYSRARPGLLVLADDSGLEVDALGGAPGVRSARYAEDAGFRSAPGMTTDARNNACLLQALTSKALPRPWTARYRCVLAVAREGVTLDTAEGAIEGEIVAEPRGNSGFGYDPLFCLPELDRTMAEIDAATKLGFSHRGRALAALLRCIERW